MDFKTHLFICTAAPDKVGKCGNKNSEEMRKKLKDRCAKEPWGKQVRINASGCLGHCEQGISCVIYPEAKWFFEQSTESEDFLFEEVKKNTLK